MMKKLDLSSGLVLTCFVGIHLVNHLCSLIGTDMHLAVMEQFRKVYRNVFFESVLLLAVTLQIISGLRLLFSKQKKEWTGYARWQAWSGFYLAIFLLIHVASVFTGRFVLQLDTNIYFGAAGLNSFPVNLFFIPYYVLAIAAFFIHLAAIHAQRMQKNICGLSVHKQVRLFVAIGIMIAVVVLYGLINGFQGLLIPDAYNIFN